MELCPNANFGRDSFCFISLCVVWIMILFVGSFLLFMAYAENI